MSKNGNEKELNFGDIEVKTFEDALLLIFSNTTPIGIAIEPISDDEDDPDDRSEYEKERDIIFGLMSDKEIEAYDTLDNFINSPKIDYPEDFDSIDARIDQAEWNTEEYRAELVHVLAEFEATVAYYITIKTHMPERSTDIAEELDGIQRCLDKIRVCARKHQVLEKIEMANLRMDLASCEMNDAFVERETLQDQLHELYELYADDED